MHHRVNSKLARTNNAVEGWHNAFKSGINCHHPGFLKLLSHLTGTIITRGYFFLQREQSLQEAILVKQDAGEHPKTSQLSAARNERILSIVATMIIEKLSHICEG